MLVMSVLYWNMVASDNSEAAVAWFASVHRKDSFDCYVGNDCK